MPGTGSIVSWLMADLLIATLIEFINFVMNIITKVGLNESFSAIDLGQ